MIVRKFVCKEHNETGESGWRPSWMPHFDPLEGMGVAHDTLEHTTDDDGSIEAEFKAFGAIVWLRDGSGWFHRHSPFNPHVEHQMSGDFLQQAYYLEGRKLRRAPRTCRLSDRWAEAAIDRCIHTGIGLIRDECGNEMARLIDPESARSYMRIGYRRTQRRFANTSPHHVACLFDQIMDQANKALKGAEYDDELLVRVDLQAERVYVETVYPE